MFHKKKFKEIEIKATPGDAPSQKGVMNTRWYW